MFNKDMLLNLLEEEINHLNQTLYQSTNIVLYQELLNKINKMNTDNIPDITEVELSLLSMPNQEKLKQIPLLKEMAPFLDKEELERNMKSVKDELLNAISNIMADYYRLLRIKEDLASDVIDNYEYLLNLVNNAYQQKKININELIDITFYVISTYGNSKKQEDKEEIETSVILENEESIEEQLRQVFSKYGYDYDKLSAGNRELLNKYANVDYVSYALNILSTKYNITEIQLLNEITQNNLTKILIIKEQNTFDDTINFIDKNECSILTIINMTPSVFKSEKKKYQRISREHGVSKNLNDIDIIGSHNAFIENVRFYKTIVGIDTIKDDDLKEKITMFNTPHSVIKRNYEILKKYHIIKDGDFPASYVSLIGKYTDYNIDHYIELGLYDYISKVGLSYVAKTKSSFKFYKLKRAIAMGDKIKFGTRMYRTFTDDTSYDGITLREEDGKKNIEQRDISDVNEEGYSKKTLMARDKLPGNWQLISDKAMLNAKIFNTYYRYNDKRLTPLKEMMLDKVSMTYDYEVDIKTDKYIEFLDNNFKTSDLTYTFLNYDGSKTIISRNKVLRLYGSLVKNNMWIDEDMNEEDILDKLISIVVKDSILSEYEYGQIYLNIRKQYTENFTKERGRK